MTLGPVQLLVIGFDDLETSGAVLAELARLREHEIIRVLDLIVVRKADDGRAERIHHKDLDDTDGAALAALLGLEAADGDDGAAEALLAEAPALGEDDFWYLEDAVPAGAAAAVALVEHRWAIPLRSAIRNEGGFHLADAWVHPVDLVAAGLLTSADAAEQA